MNQQQDDEVLLDYLATLLMDGQQESSAQEAMSSSQAGEQRVFADGDFPMTCLAAKIGTATIAIPIAEVAAMQALAGPLYGAQPWQQLPAFLPSQHSSMTLLDIAKVVKVLSPDYQASAWRGHLLKLKALDAGVLVDAIIGPSQVTTAPHEQSVESYAWGDIGAMAEPESWLLAHFKG